MIPIHKLLSRIQWDHDFGRGNFEIGYYDRVLDAIVRVPLAKVSVGPASQDRVEITDSAGIIHSIPLHRIKEVYREKELIWQRSR